MSVWDWVGDAVDTAGRAVSDVADALGSVPIVGGLLEAVFSPLAAPFKIADNIAKGVSLDKVIMRQLEDGLNAAKTIAPYVQAVISFVPGIGPIASGAMGVAIALANGRRIDQALLDGAKSALPGGPLAKMAFDAAQAAIEGKSVQEIGIAALPIPDQAKTLIASGLDVVSKLAAGQNISKSLLDAAMKQLPPAAQTAAKAAIAAGEGGKVSDILLDVASDAMADLPEEQRKAVKNALGIGMALAQGRNIQNAVENLVTSDEFISAFAGVGKDFAVANPVLNAARGMSTGSNGFDVAIGLMAKRDLKRFILATAREAFRGDDLKGFDLGVSAYRGMVLQRFYKLYGSPAISQPLREFIKSRPDLNLNNFVETKGIMPTTKATEASSTLKSYIDSRNLGLSSLRVDAPTQSVLNPIPAAAPPLSTLSEKLALIYKATGNPVMQAASQVVTPQTEAAHAITLGMMGQSADNKQTMMATIIQTPDGKNGATLAVAQVQVARADEAPRSLLQMILDFFFGKPVPTTLALQPPQAK